MPEAKPKTNIWEELRKPFPKEAIGKLVKPTISNDEWKKLPRSTCTVCGGYHPSQKMIHLDYVGHANVTDRLNSVDPTWTWEPMATSEHGLPLADSHGNLWIKLTVGGVTRPGVGDGKNMKEMIGDAIRNAAMRFGVALDLWTKDELESQHEDATPAPVKKPTIDPPSPEEPSVEIDDDVTANPVRDKELIAKARLLMKEQGLVNDKAKEFIQFALNKDVPVTKSDYKQLVDLLESQSESKRRT